LAPFFGSVEVSMRWEGGGRESENVEDRRGRGPRVALGGGIGALAIVALITLLSGGDLSSVFRQLDTGGGASPGGTVAVSPEEKEQEHTVRLVLGSTEDVWGDVFRGMGKTYERPRLVLFRGSVDSACGQATAAVGPFYCPGDRQVYLDLGFFTELAQRFRSPGDFAQAYVVAHEVGHHVQNLLGISDRVHRLELQSRGEAEKNRYSVRLELQADGLAGVWAHHAQKKGLILDVGDLEEAIRAAQAIGDDSLQKQARGYAVPDSFTHGTSAQRIAWFRRGFDTGDLNEVNTFDEATWSRVNPR
jgi:predicted metalloprotease